MSFDSTLSYYDVKGRTWERQAFVKARPIAGDLRSWAASCSRGSSRGFIASISAWPTSRASSRSSAASSSAPKREGGDVRNVKTGHGGIRDIEFVIQFLQLLNGGALPEVRTGNTLEAIARLEKAGSLTPDERAKLEDNYSMLRKLEHRLQIMFDLQDARAAERAATSWRKLAVRMGYTGTRHNAPLEAFQDDYARRTRAESRDARSSAAQRLSRRRRPRSRKSTWSTIRIRRRSEFRKCSAAIRSQTFRPRIKT